MRINTDIADTLLAEAQRACGLASKKQIIEEALRLMIRLHRQKQVRAAFGKYRGQGNLTGSRSGRRAR
jgi:Arc/MetJ family transcription regulator